MLRHCRPHGHPVSVTFKEALESSRPCPAACLVRPRRQWSRCNWYWACAVSNCVLIRYQYGIRYAQPAALRRRCIAQKVGETKGIRFRLNLIPLASRTRLLCGTWLPRHRAAKALWICLGNRKFCNVRASVGCLRLCQWQPDCSGQHSRPSQWRSSNPST